MKRISLRVTFVVVVFLEIVLLVTTYSYAVLSERYKAQQQSESQQLQTCSGALGVVESYFNMLDTVSTFPVQRDVLNRNTELFLAWANSQDVASDLNVRKLFREAIFEEYPLFPEVEMIAMYTLEGNGLYNTRHGVTSTYETACKLERETVSWFEEALNAKGAPVFIPVSGFQHTGIPSEESLFCVARSLMDVSTSDYLSEAGTKAALLQTEEAVFFLHQFFGHLTPETLTPEQIRRKLSDWVYALMQANNKFIEPISQDRLTENDLFSHIRNLPTLQQLSQQFTQIIELYLRYLSSNVVSKNAFLIKKALAYIDAHYRENPSLEEVASSLFISASYFSALFSKTMGESFRTYLLKLKMEEAKRLLSQSDIKILDIAYQMGYEDLSHFNRAFKKVIGCSPSHFRKISQG